jgi:hypothetical protein
LLANCEISPIPPSKRLRKAFQRPQFSIYEDETSREDSSNLDNDFNSTSVETKPQLGKIQPNISVEIPFRPEFHTGLEDISLQKYSKNTSQILKNLAINSSQRVPKIPRKWTEKQPNDHTSK